MGQFGVGQSVSRVEDQRLLSGQGRYTDDAPSAGAARVAFVRSPHANARLDTVETSAARAAPGVLAVYTVADLDAAGVKDIPCLAALPGRDGKPPVMPGHPVLARGQVRHVGDPVAAVVAETAEAAADAAELVEVDYAPLDHVVNTEGALAPEAAQVHADAPGNLCLDWDMGDAPAVEKAFAAADRVTRIKLVNNRVVVNAMEPRAALADYDGESGTWTLTTGSQGVFSLRDQLARHIFDVDPARIHVVTPDVGGGFGMKMFLYAEQVLVMHAARDLGRPVKWTGSRGESFQSDSQGRDHVTEAALATDAEGRILGLKVDTTANMGAYLSNFAPFIATKAGAGMLPGVYNVPAFYVRTRCVFTNTVPVDAYRGAGRPEASYVIERLVDAAARERGMSPARFRELNYIAPSQMPHTTVTGQTYDSGDFARVQRTALDHADIAGLEARKAAARRRGKLLGLGHASYIECCAGIGKEAARFELNADGSVVLDVGTQSNGQGHETAYAQLVADRLGLTPEQVRVRQGDTERLPFGGGTGGSRSLLMGGGASEAVTDKAIQRMKDLAGFLLEAASADIEFEAGTFTIAGTDRRVSLTEVAAASARADLPENLRGGIDETATYDAPPMTYPNGCHVCEIEVDEATGVPEIARYVIVDDAGTIMNPLMLRGQIHGGTAQGIGQALFEETVYEPESGQLVTATFQDYTMPRADDLPPFEVHFVEDIPCATNPMGVKGAGEAGCIGAPPAVINALVDALAPYGIRHIDMPATPSRIWTLLRNHTSAAAAE
jgi:carbon-monoxide dehydrogenase large subunit